MFTKAKNFYLENRLVFNMWLSIALIFLSSFWFPFMYLLVAWLLFSYWTLDTSDMLSLTAFLMMFSGMIILFIVSAVYSFVVLAGRYIIKLKKKEAKVFKIPLILTASISVIWMAIVYSVDIYSVFQGLLIVVLLFFLYFVLVQKEDIDISNVFKYLLYGMICASVMAVFFNLVPYCKTLAYTNWKLEMISIKDMMFHIDSGGVYRCSLLSFHINHLAVIMLVACAYAVNSFIAVRGKTKEEMLTLSLLFLFGMGIGFFTMSKTFIVGAIIVIIIGIIGGIVHYKTKSLKVIIPIIVLLALIVAIFHEKVFGVFDRFLGYGYTSIFTRITTGRNEIWAQYFNDMLHPVTKLIFGAGLFTKEVVSIGPHSTYMFIFYRFGIVGSLAILALIVAYYKELKKYDNKFNIKKILPLLMCLLVFVIEACADERFFFFVFALLFMIESPKTKVKMNITKLNQRYRKNSKKSKK